MYSCGRSFLRWLVSPRWPRRHKHAEIGWRSGRDAPPPSVSPRVAGSGARTPHETRRFSSPCASAPQKSASTARWKTWTSRRSPLPPSLPDLASLLEVRPHGDALAQVTALSDLLLLGLVYRRKHNSRRYYPTPLASLLLADDSALATQVHTAHAAPAAPATPPWLERPARRCVAGGRREPRARDQLPAVHAHLVDALTAGADPAGEGRW